MVAALVGTPRRVLLRSLPLGVVSEHEGRTAGDEKGLMLALGPVLAGTSLHTVHSEMLQKPTPLCGEPTGEEERGRRGGGRLHSVSEKRLQSFPRQQGVRIPESVLAYYLLG